MTRSRIITNVDFDQDGRQEGFLQLPHSVHRSAYGWIGIPIIVLKNGSGPTVFLQAGNHGDEYEGELSLIRLCQDLDVDQVAGRIIILPAANYPAVRAGTRTSPLDNGNLNRLFPGDPDGTPSAAIAHYIEEELVPRADFIVDLHSGGSSLMYIPSSLSRHSDDPEIEKTQLEMMKTFGAPVGYYANAVGATGDDRTTLAGADRKGVPAIGTELGGSGSTTVFSLEVAELGVRRILKMTGVADVDVSEPAEPTRVLEVPGLEYYVYAPDFGFWQPLVELGDEVTKGQPAALVYNPDTPWQPPVTTHFEADGIVICRRVPTPVHRGDCLFHLGSDYAH